MCYTIGRKGAICTSGCGLITLKLRVESTGVSRHLDATINVLKEVNASTRLVNSSDIVLVRGGKVLSSDRV
jgi:hypothetical protein